MPAARRHKMPLAEDNNVVEALSAHRAKRAFTDRIQAGRARRDLHDRDPRSLGNGSERPAELAVVITNQIRRGLSERRCLSKLLGGARVGGMPGHIEVHDFPRAMNHDEECEDEAKQHVVVLQEVAGPDATAVIAEEGEPVLTTFPWRTDLPHVLLDRPLANSDAEFRQLASNALCAPQHVVGGHAWMSVATCGASRFARYLDRDFRRQTILNSSRCQRSNVSGLTRCNESRHRRVSRAKTSSSRRSSP